MLRAVLDTNVFLRGLLNPHSRCGRLLNEFALNYQLVTAPEVVREVLEVLQRPKLRAKFPQLRRLDLEEMLALFEQAEVAEPATVPAVCRDPDEDKFLACAAVGGAHFLVTEDRDLLDLGTHGEVRIVKPAEFLEVLASESTATSARPRS